MRTAEIPKRFYSLDVIRGFAALSVVLFHWRHFFYKCTNSLAFESTKQPFYYLFSLFYQKGNLSVDLFFSISGFVFFWLYAREIYLKKVSGWSFFILRFSRLYPLQFLTLILVLLGQVTSKYLLGCYTVYLYNDPYHFLLNLFFVSGWGFEKGLSFNGPVWSVSIEVLLYILFYFFSKWGLARYWLVICGVAAAGVFIHFLPHGVKEGIFSFFIGGLVYVCYEKLVKYNSTRIMGFCATLTIFLWAVALLEFRYNIISNLSEKIYFLRTHKRILELIFNYFPTAVLFPITLLSLALVEAFRGTLGARLRFIGDISYSSYLLHFPLQLVFILLISKFQINSDFFYTIPCFLIYFLFLLSLSFLSYNRFERPLQKYIREKFLKRR